MSHGVAVLGKYSVPAAHATNVMNVLIGAEARGFGSHGLLRLERLITGIKAKTHIPDAEAVINEKGVCFEVDGAGGLGPHYSTVLMDKVVEKASTQGVSVGVARNMSHFGFGGYYTEMAAE